MRITLALKHIFFHCRLRHTAFFPGTPNFFFALLASLRFLILDHGEVSASVGTGHLVDTGAWPPSALRGEDLPGPEGGKVKAVCQLKDGERKRPAGPQNAPKYLMMQITKFPTIPMIRRRHVYQKLFRELERWARG